jgi:hypothetical protein
MMIRRLSDRLVSLALAAFVTFAIVAGIHGLAASEAALAASQMAEAGLAGAPICARV